MKPRLTLLVILLLASAAALLFALMTGSISIRFSDLGKILDHTPSTEKNLILELRLPRALAAYMTGAMLALAGALMQVLLRNPLADPYVLGVSGGAASGALGAILLGAGTALVSTAAMMGALLSMLLVFALARQQGSWSPARLLLTGIVIASGWTALISFLLTVGQDTQLPAMLFWLMGDLGQARNPYWQMALLLLVLAIIYPQSRNLNLLSRGEMHAGSLGVPVHATRLQIYLAASLLTAAAVSLAGSIGFVGLVVPHMLRLMGASDHRVLLPASILLGGSLLVVADTLARTVISPVQLPVGVITAALGVPLFLYLLRRAR